MPQRNRTTYQRRYRKTDSFKEARPFHNMARLNVTLDEYHALFERQNEQCAICRDILKPIDKNTHIDHDHNTKKIRGLLCQRCNVGLGHFRDSPKLLREAANYLSENPSE